MVFDDGSTGRVEFRGLVTTLDEDRMTFELRLADGAGVVVPFGVWHLGLVRDAFGRGSTHEPSGVLVAGIGRHGPDHQFLSWESIALISALDPLDVVFRLDGFRGLEAGWLNGDGKGVPGDGLDWLSGRFCLFYPPDAGLPHTYPTAEGGVQFEWPSGFGGSPGSSREVILEVDLNRRSGSWNRLDLVTGESDSGEVDLDWPESWAWFFREVLGLRAGADGG